MNKIQHGALMVRDWVYNDKGNPCKITVTYEGSAWRQGTDGIRYQFSDINPAHGIPITKDILVKNNLSVSEQGMCFLPHSDISLSFSDDYVSVLDSDYNAFLAIHYVHELQHLLRLIYPNGDYKIDHV